MKVEINGTNGGRRKEIGNEECKRGRRKLK
jgi:hypothetical protein